MTERVAPSGPEQRGAYWDDRYERIGAKQVSWYQTRPRMSLELIDALQVGASTAVIDVGGGTSTLVDELLRRDFNDITILDVSVSALAIARQRLGDPDNVTGFMLTCSHGSLLVTGTCGTTEQCSTS